MQIFVRNLSGQSIPFEVELGAECPVWKLHELVEAREGVPCASQRLIYAGRQLDVDSPLAHYGVSAGSTLHLVARLLGGKGGFGALLRGQGRDGKVTNNFDAMRDLQGRRIRHSKCEEKLEEWRNQAHERELEKIALRHIKEVSKEKKKEQKYQVRHYLFRRDWTRRLFACSQKRNLNFIRITGQCGRGRSRAGQDCGKSA